MKDTTRSLDDILDGLNVELMTGEEENLLPWLDTLDIALTEQASDRLSLDQLIQVAKCLSSITPDSSSLSKDEDQSMTPLIDTNALLTQVSSTLGQQIPAGIKGNKYFQQLVTKSEEVIKQ